MNTRSLLRLALAVLPAGALTAQATVFQGTPGGTGDVWVYSAPGRPPSRPSALQGITLLPVDATGRTEFTEFFADQPRLRTDIPGAARVHLPQNKGSLYRFRKERTGGGADFGYFVVRDDGMASFLLAVPGTGPTGTDDPIPDPVSLTGDGKGMLFSTEVAAGGDLFELALDTGVVSSPTASVGPLDIPPHNLMLLDTWGTALTTRGPVRFDRGASTIQAVPLLVPKVGQGHLGQNQLTTVLLHRPGYLAPGIVRSADGTTVAVVAGAVETAAHIFTFGRTGPSTRVNDVPAPIPGAGYLPGSQSGPLLALSANGSRVAWKTNVVDPQTHALSGECFSRRVPTVVVPDEVQITGDDNFTDTLDETGVIAFFDPDSVFLIVGERNGANGVEHGDVFRARIGGGSLALTNVSNTSGDVVAPFEEKGDIETADGVFLIPDGSGWTYFVPGSSGQGKIIRLDTTTGISTVLRTGVDEVDFVEVAGDNFLYGILNDSPALRELVKVPFDHSAPATSLGLFQFGEIVLRRNVHPAGRFVGVQAVPGGQRVGLLDLNTDSIDVLTNQPLTYGPTVGFAGSGAALASVDSGLASYVFSWTGPKSFVLYPTGGARAFVLPGL